ncbi:MAG: T9SS type A sorting domain-containing protein [Ignavibacterium sp.]|nr:T9SS type A sorting domain-containing protein [Ignavibacterium sp.]
MKSLPNAILILSMALLLSSVKIYSQTVDLRFIVIQNDQTVNGTYAVKAQIKLNTESDMGTSSIQFSYNTAGLDFPSTPVENTHFFYHNFQGFIPGGVPFTNYSSTVTRPILGKVSINIVLSIGADGQTITTDWMDIASIYFTILDINEFSNLQWIQETTTIFNDLNSQFTNGTFFDENSPLPVELSSFTSKLINDKVQLNWQTATEVSNYGFNVERSVKDGEWSTIGFVEGYGNSNSPKSYSFSDKDLFAGGSEFRYRLKQIDTDGKFEYSDVVAVTVIPTQFELAQNYPNPFNPATTIRFSLPQSTQIKLNVYNLLGQQIATIAEGLFEQGFHKVEFNASELPSGAYIYRIESANFVQVKKMVLIK